MNELDTKNSAIEAIYWWNRTEGYYHKYFKKLDTIYKNKEHLNFFISKLFNVFLSDYSVRRNINKGRESVKSFLDEIVEYKFIQKVKEGEVNCVDSISTELLDSGKSVSKQTISLLSKFAFLINPNDFSLYDTLAREAVWKICKSSGQRIKKSSLTNYLNFITKTDELIQLNEQILREQELTLQLFKGTQAFEFFTKNIEAFNRRIMDKYFWIYEQKQNNDSRTFNNLPYVEFLKM